MVPHCAHFPTADLGPVESLLGPHPLLALQRLLSPAPLRGDWVQRAWGPSCASATPRGEGPLAAGCSGRESSLPRRPSCRRRYSPSRSQACPLPECEQNPGPVGSGARRDSGRRGHLCPRRAAWWASGLGRAGLTRAGSKSCSICRSFLLFSSSRRRSFVFIRSSSLFCMRNDWRKKGLMHPAPAARTCTTGDTRLGGRSEPPAACTHTAGDTWLGGRSRPPGSPGAGWQWAGPGRQGKKHRRARRHWVGTGRGPARCRTTHAARDAVPHEERYRRTLWAVLLPGAGSRVLRGHPRSPRWSHHL